MFSLPFNDIGHVRNYTDIWGTLKGRDDIFIDSEVINTSNRIYGPEFVNRVTKAIDYVGPNRLFINYQDKHADKPIIFFGSGPTIKRFSIPCKNFITVGVNDSLDYFDLDYLFVGDSRYYASNTDKINNYTPKISKFLRIANKHSKNHGCSFKKATFKHYIGTRRIKNSNSFYTDICKGMAIGESISFEAMQFILYTGAKEVYLVGHDCNDGRYINKWKMIKRFIGDRCKIISINPVGLSGLFIDRTTID